MSRTVITVVLLVVLVVLLAFNIGSTGTVSLFGARFESVPVISISLGSFALGAVFTLLVSVGHAVGKRRRAGLKERESSLKEREAAGVQAAAPGAAGPVSVPRTAREKVLGFFTRKR